MQDNMDYVPADIVKILFEQNQKTIELNTIAVKEMTEAVNELAKVMAYPPTKKDIIELLKEHEIHCGSRVKDTYNILEKITEDDEKRQNIIKTEQEKQYSIITNLLNSIKTTIEGLSNKVVLMIAVVLITFSLLSISYVFVNNSMNHNIKKTVEDTIKDQNSKKPINSGDVYKNEIK